MEVKINKEIRNDTDSFLSSFQQPLDAIGAAFDDIGVMAARIQLECGADPLFPGMIDDCLSVFLDSADHLVSCLVLFAA